jgi:hypothetical protein
VQIASDPAPFLFLYVEQLLGEASQFLFGLLAIFDIRVCPVPSDDTPFGIAQGYGAR